ncbi:VWA domain-containing protein [Candidatus Poribacteria bacterium]|nr:VWA domain-containing protein [Candidatus Poribacteria bacterium]
MAHTLNIAGAAVRRAGLCVLVAAWALTAQRSRAQCYAERPEPAAQHVVLAIDSSGSMRGAPLANARAGAKEFVSAMRADDKVCVVAFDSTVRVLQMFTSDRTRLHAAINSIEPGGTTALYDAIARGALLLARAPGRRMLVYLTDARDVSSRYTLHDIREMNVCEGVLVFGIGLGSVDTASLSALSAATSGSFEQTHDVGALTGIYMRLQDAHARNLRAAAAETGTLTVRSIPSGQEALVGGRKIGLTPVRIVGAKPGAHDVQVLFEKGAWECSARVDAGNITTVEARDSDLGADVVIVSRPAGAAVFMDDGYVGLTSYGKPISTAQSDWPRRARNDPAQLVVRRMPYGTHTLRLRGAPDFDFGPEQEIEVEITVRHSDTVLFVDILRGHVRDHTGEIVGRGATRDPFSELDGDK